VKINRKEIIKNFKEHHAEFNVYPALQVSDGALAAPTRLSLDVCGNLDTPFGHIKLTRPDDCLAKV